jgi:hypothetical protein
MNNAKYTPADKEKEKSNETCRRKIKKGRTILNSFFSSSKLLNELSNMKNV